ncbi:hypothetical protein J6590_036487 [Homalodisca vitripennis]|nr:hypothetical protein J6590_036487 [Homalodisca vitripennis]
MSLQERAKGRAGIASGPLQFTSTPLRWNKGPAGDESADTNETNAVSVSGQSPAMSGVPPQRAAPLL